MNDKLSDETEIKDHLWRHGEHASHSSSAENSMSDKQKIMIRRTLEFDIINIRSYTGYKGDLLLQITTIKEDVAQSLKNIAETLSLEVVIKKNVLSIYNIYCISPSTNLYELK